MLGLIVEIIISWYFFNYIENNSYIKNVIIYSSANFVVSILNNLISGTELHIIASALGSIVGGLIIVKIMEFAKERTNNLVMFIILTEVCEIICFFVIALLYRIMI